MRLARDIFSFPDFDFYAGMHTRSFPVARTNKTEREKRIIRNKTRSTERNNTSLILKNCHTEKYFGSLNQKV